jgi:beta-glucanase (GH16 family)
MTLRFDDEFNNRLSLWNGSAGTWRTVFGYGGPAAKSNRSADNNTVYVDSTWTGVNGEMAPINPFSVNNGALSITETKLTAAQSKDNWGMQYASGLLTTKMSFSQEYGYFEVNAKLPSGQGMWPAFWLLPENNSWPPELDVFEQLGKNPDTLYLTSHGEVAGKPTSLTQSVEVPNATTQFHTYGVLWTPSELVWYVDGRAVAEAATPADMHTPMYMLLDLDVGGAWGGGVTSATPSGQSLKVNWVRAYSLADSPVGSGQSPAPPPTPNPPTSGAQTRIGGANTDHFAINRSELSTADAGAQVIISKFDGGGVWRAADNDWLSLVGFSAGSSIRWVDDTSGANKYGVYDIHDADLNHDFLVEIQSTDGHHLNAGDYQFY